MDEVSDYDVVTGMLHCINKYSTVNQRLGSCKVPINLQLLLN